MAMVVKPVMISVLAILMDDDSQKLSRVHDEFWLKWGEMGGWLIAQMCL